jgi:hypothetical protein
MNTFFHCFVLLFVVKLLNFQSLMRTRQGAITHYGLQRYEVFSECANFCCLFSLRLLIFYVFAEKKQERGARKGVFCRQKSRSEEGEKESGSDSHRHPILMNEVPIAAYWA